MRQSSCWLYEKQLWDMEELDMPLENYNAKKFWISVLLEEMVDFQESKTLVREHKIKESKQLSSLWRTVLH